MRLCLAYPGNPRCYIEGESPHLWRDIQSSLCGCPKLVHLLGHVAEPSSCLSRRARSLEANTTRETPNSSAYEPSHQVSITPAEFAAGLKEQGARSEQATGRTAAVCGASALRPVASLSHEGHSKQEVTSQVKAGTEESGQVTCRGWLTEPSRQSRSMTSSRHLASSARPP
jgi:hypothetical protein